MHHTPAPATHLPTSRPTEPLIRPRVVGEVYNPGPTIALSYNFVDRHNFEACGSAACPTHMRPSNPGPTPLEVWKQCLQRTSRAEQSAARQHAEKAERDAARVGPMLRAEKGATVVLKQDPTAFAASFQRVEDPQRDNQTIYGRKIVGEINLLSPEKLRRAGQPLLFPPDPTPTGAVFVAGARAKVIEAFEDDSFTAQFEDGERFDFPFEVIPAKPSPGASLQTRHHPLAQVIATIEKGEAKKTHHGLWYQENNGDPDFMKVIADPTWPHHYTAPESYQEEHFADWDKRQRRWY